MDKSITKEPSKEIVAELVWQMRTDEIRMPENRIIEVIQARKAGYQIQARGYYEEWCDIYFADKNDREGPIWNFGYYEYRVKPKK